MLPGHRAWAVGYQVTTAGQTRTLTEFCNGSRWAIEPSPSPGSSDELHGVTLTRSGTVWAVCFTQAGSLILRRSGSRWVVASTASDALLQAVTTMPAGQVWAVGYRFNGSDLAEHTVTLRLSGSTWQAVASPNVRAAHGHDAVRRRAVDPGPQPEPWLQGRLAVRRGGSPAPARCGRSVA
jgi:hypothetical protein